MHQQLHRTATMYCVNWMIVRVKENIVALSIWTSLLQHVRQYSVHLLATKWTVGDVCVLIKLSFWYFVKCENKKKKKARLMLALSNSVIFEYLATVWFLFHFCLLFPEVIVKSCKWTLLLTFTSLAVFVSPLTLWSTRKKKITSWYHQGKPGTYCWKP